MAAKKPLPESWGHRDFADTWPAPMPYGEQAQAFEEKNQARILAQQAEAREEARRLEQARRAEEHRKAEELRVAIEVWERNVPLRAAAERERSVLELELVELDERQGQIERRLRAINDLCRHPKEEDDFE